jgi:DNA-binding PadR family transcriptional regulator
MLIELSKGQELSGYDILTHLNAFGLRVSPSTVYYQLKRLSKEGILIHNKRGRKKTYQMTEQGMNLFIESRKAWTKPLAYAHANLKD